MTDFIIKDNSYNDTTSSQKIIIKEIEKQSSRSSQSSPRMSLKSHKRKKESTLSTLNINLTSCDVQINVQRKYTRNNSPLKYHKDNDSVNKLSTDGLCRNRFDFYGNTIKKGIDKKHKVTFVDKISNRDFLDIQEIDSFKRFNLDISKDIVRCDCTCVIF